MSEAVKATATGVRLSVHAQPGAKRTQFAGLHADSVKIRVHAPPVEGKANDELIRFLAASFDLSRSNVILVRGEKSRSKTFELRGVDVAFVLSRLA